MKNLNESLDMLISKVQKSAASISRNLNNSEKQLVLEVGNHATKMIEYIVKKDKIQVLNGFVINTPLKAIENDRIVETGVLSNMLLQSIRQANIKTKDFVVSIVSKEIIIREMDVPKLNNKDLVDVIKFNSRSIFPVNLSNYVLGYTMIQKGEKNRVMLSAIPKEIVESYIKLGEKLGLSLKGINYSGYELYNFLDFELGTSDEAYLAVDFGAKNTNIIIISEGILKFNKIIPKGFAEATQYICEELNCNVTKAEQLKRQYSIIEPSPTAAPNSEEYIVAKYTKRAIDSIMQDITRIIEFYNANNPKRKISKIYIIGMIGKIKGIEDYFFSKFNIKSKSIKLLQKVDFAKKAMNLKPRQLNLLNCFGASNLQDRRFVFLKGNLKIKKRSFLLKAEFHKLMIVVVLGVLAYIGYMFFSINDMTKKIEEYTTFIESKSEIKSLQRKIVEKQSELQDIENVIYEIGVGAEGHIDIIELIETSVIELSKDAKLKITQYKFSMNTKEANSGETKEFYKTIEIMGLVNLPEGIDENSAEGVRYLNLPYSLNDKLQANGYTTDIARQDNKFKITIKIKEVI